MHERLQTGHELLTTATVLLQRRRAAHPTAGVFEAADVQWWWRSPRSTDDAPHLVWVDDDGTPVATVVMTAWKDSVSLVPVVQPSDDAAWREHVIERGLQHADALGLGPLSIAAAAADEVTRRIVTGLGLTVEAEEGSDGWLAVRDRPDVGPLPPGYRLASRAETHPAPHHFFLVRGVDDEPRLRQTSLYRDDLDLVVLGPDGAPAAYGLFWFDPATRTGIVEPMRTVDAHQRRGLARHVLTAGVERLAEAGAERVKIAWAPDGPAGGLYTDVGFGPPRRCVVFTRPA